jgi:hypothetical protein
MRLPLRRTRIRRLFLHRVESYGLQEAANLIGITPAELQERVETGEFEGYRWLHEWRFRWHHLASIAFDKWGLAVVVAALGTDAPMVLPPMAQPRMVSFLLPDYQVRMLYFLARKGDVDADAYLSEHLLDLAAANLETLELAFPGFTAAMRFPEE